MGRHLTSSVFVRLVKWDPFAAMVAVKLDHSDLAQHQAGIFKWLHTFRKEGQLCDVVLKSSEGTEHYAHSAILCAASEELKNMLVGPFVESNQVQQGQPVEIAASDAAVFGFLECIYSQQPQVLIEEEEGSELLHLADAYKCPHLSAAIWKGLIVSFDSAPVAIKLEHPDLAQHQAGIFKWLHTFRKEGQLCDVVLKSSEGTQHHAHSAILCAASEGLKNMLVGPFAEANQIQQGQPVEMAASDEVVFGLLEYIYGQQPQVEEENAFELLHLADAYNCPHLTAAIEAGFGASLDSAPVTTALKVLQLPQNLRDLKVACEEKVAANFELCIEQVEFLDLSAGQLGRILRRDDLKVSREEAVLKGLLNWLNKSKDRGVCLGSLLLNVDLQSLSSDNLAQLMQLSASMGPVGHDLQREVEDSLQDKKKRSRAESADAFLPKRLCLRHWSPDLGASLQAAQKVLPSANSLCWHDGAIYYYRYDRNNDFSPVFRWKLGDAESQDVAGRGPTVNGVNELSETCIISVTPDGKIFLADPDKDRLVSYQSGFSNVVLSDVGLYAVSCSPSGAVYVATRSGLHKLVGDTLRPVISNEHLREELQFLPGELFTTDEEVVYISDYNSPRVLRLKPGDTEPAVVGEAPNKESSSLYGLFVTEHEKIYVADMDQRKVWAFYPGDAAWTEVLTCPRKLRPVDVLVQGRSLYVSMICEDDAAGICEYLLPPELQLA